MPRVDRMSAYALKALIRTMGSESVNVDGVPAGAFLVSDESSLNPMMGGMVSDSQRTILVAKAEHPERPADNCNVMIGDESLVAVTITDRHGYWSIVCDEPIT